MEILVTIAMAFVVAAFAIVVVDRLIALLLQFFAPYLPDDLAGPDGWMLDTERGTGVFDRSSSISL